MNKISDVERTEFFRKAFSDAKEALDKIEKMCLDPSTDWMDIDGAFQDLEPEHFGQILHIFRCDDPQYVKENCPCADGLDDEEVED